MNYDLKGRRKDNLKQVPRSHTTGRGCKTCDYCRSNRRYRTTKELHRMTDAEENT